MDPTIAATAARRVADLLVRFGGGQVAATATVVGQPVVRQPITIDGRLSARVAGFPIDEDTAAALLGQVGCDVTLTGHDLTATPPPWRHDISDPNDLVEEVVRIVGYDKVPSVLPSAPAGRGLTRVQRLRRRVGVTLAGAGYVEAPGSPFVGSADWEDLGLAADDPRRRAMRVVNPLSEEQPLLRTTLLPGLLRTLARNVARGQADIGIFEIASVVLPSSDGATPAPVLGVDRAPTIDELKAIEASLPDQPLHLAVAVCGDRVPKSWWGPAQRSCWADAVEAARTVGRSLGLDLAVGAASRRPWHPGRCAEILIGETSVGNAGELHPRVCAAFGLPARSAAVELNLAVLLAHAVGIVRAPRLSSYPVGKEDVALVVDVGVPAADVEAALLAGAGDLLESVRLFDVYVGEQAGHGKKSLGYALRFRALDRTLTEAEISAARDAAVAEAGSRLGAVQRT